jgi:hypothetical protein
MRFPRHLAAAPALVFLLCGALVGDDPKPAPPPKAPALPPLFRKLGLSDEQVKNIGNVRATYAAKVKDLEEKIRAARAEEAAELEKVLTDAQRARLKELRGAQTPAPAGLRLGHRFAESVVKGPYAGQKRSLICELAGRPAVLIYARAMDPTLVTLLTKLDAVAQRAQDQNMRSCCVLLTSADKEEAALRDFARRADLGATILATLAPAEDERYFGSWPHCRLSPEATVTVLVLRRLEVQTSYAFGKGELDDAHVEEIVKAASALLPAPKDQ